MPRMRSAGIVLAAALALTGACADSEPLPDHLSARAAAQITSAEAACSTLPSTAAPVQRARAHLNAARHHHTYGSLRGAARHYDAVLAETPGNLEAAYLRAHVHRDEGEALQAAEAFAATAARCTSAHQTQRRAAAHFWAALMWRELGEAQRELDALQQAAAASPASPAIHVALSRALRESGDLQRAAVALQIAAEHAPDEGAVLIETIAVRRAFGDTSGAAVAAEEATGAGTRTLLPDDEVYGALVRLGDTDEALRSRAESLFAQERFEEAVDVYRTLVERAPSDPSRLADLGIALTRGGRSADARAALERALAIDASHRASRLAMATVAATTGDDEEAIAHCMAVLAETPNDADALYQSGCSLARLGNVEGASLAWAACLATGSSHAVAARRLLVRALGRLGRYAEAVATLEEQSQGMEIELARVLAAAPDASLRDGQRALLIARRAVNTTASVAAQETLAMACAELERFEEAAQIHRQLLGAVADEDRPRIRRRLQEYERRRPCREPWGPSEWLPVAPRY